MAKITRKTATGIAGGIIAAGVSLLILTLHASQAKVQEYALPLPDHKDIVVCKDAPEWVVRAVERKKVLSFWKDHGVTYGEVLFDQDCPAECEWPDPITGIVEMVPCRPGAIVLDMMTVDQAKIGSGSPGDRGYWIADPGLGEKLGRLRWFTTVFPAELEPPLVEDEDGFPVDTTPKDLSDLVVAHALGHAEGYDHSYTKVVGKKAVAHKRGELMNPYLEQLGWGDQGLRQNAR